MYYIIDDYSYCNCCKCSNECWGEVKASKVLTKEKPKKTKKSKKTIFVISKYLF